MIRNGSGQTLTVFCFGSNFLPKTGDAPNLTAYVSIDGGAETPLADTSAVEDSPTTAPGYYTFTLTAAETSGTKLEFTAVSSTPGVTCICVPAVTYPTGASGQAITIPSFPDGYYVVAAYTLDKYGPTNIDSEIDMEGNLSNADKLAAWGRAVSSVEGWWDALLLRKSIVVDTDATSPHVMGPANPYFARVQQLLSKDMGPEIYFARGHTSDANTNGPEGQMTQTRTEARNELEAIAQSIAERDAVLTNDPPGSFSFVPRATPVCASDEYDNGLR